MKRFTFCDKKNRLVATKSKVDSLTFTQEEVKEIISLLEYHKSCVPTDFQTGSDKRRLVLFSRLISLYGQENDLAFLTLLTNGDPNLWMSLNDNSLRWVTHFDL